MAHFTPSMKAFLLSCASYFQRQKSAAPHSGHFENNNRSPKKMCFNSVCWELKTKLFQTTFILIFWSTNYAGKNTDIKQSHLLVWQDDLVVGRWWSGFEGRTPDFGHQCLNLESRQECCRPTVQKTLCNLHHQRSRGGHSKGEKAK